MVKHLGRDVQVQHDTVSNLDNETVNVSDQDGTLPVKKGHLELTEQEVSDFFKIEYKKLQDKEVQWKAKAKARADEIKAEVDAKKAEDKKASDEAKKVVVK